jgi:hypothetical protein
VDSSYKSPASRYFNGLTLSLQAGIILSFSFEHHINARVHESEGGYRQVILGYQTRLFIFMLDLSSVPSFD